MTSRGPTPPTAPKGAKGGKARAAKLSAERRTEIAHDAAEARWRPTPPTARKRIMAQRAKQNFRVLQALEGAIYQQSLAHRWRTVVENAPTGSQMSRKAHDEWQKASQRAFDGFMLVRRALGYDPEEDEPQPKRHWDAGA